MIVTLGAPGVLCPDGTRVRITGAQPAAVLALLAADLLTGFEGDWLTQQRRRLARLRHRADLVRGEAAVALGASAAAVDIGTSLLDADPHDEAATRLLIAAHLLGGDRAAALDA